MIFFQFFLVSWLISLVFVMHLVALFWHSNDVCHNDCILYRGEEYEKLDACPVCDAKRYKIKKKVPTKVMWYFPVIPVTIQF